MEAASIQNIRTGQKLLLLNENMYRKGYITKEQYRDMELLICRKYQKSIVLKEASGL